MPIHIQCPQCGNQLHAPDHFAGKLARCPKCKLMLEVPRPEEQSAAKPAPDPIEEDQAAEPQTEAGAFDFLSDDRATPAQESVSSHSHPQPSATNKKPSSALPLIAAGCGVLLLGAIAALVLVLRAKEDPSQKVAVDTVVVAKPIQPADGQGPPSMKPPTATTATDPVTKPKTIEPPKIAKVDPNPPARPPREVPKTGDFAESPPSHEVIRIFGDDLRWFLEGTTSVTRLDIRGSVADPLCTKYPDFAPLVIEKWIKLDSVEPYKISFGKELDYIVEASRNRENVLVLHFKDPKNIGDLTGPDRRFSTHKVGEHTVYKYSDVEEESGSFFMPNERTLVQVADYLVDAVASRGGKDTGTLTAGLAKLLNPSDFEALYCNWMQIVPNGPLPPGTAGEIPPELLGIAFGDIVRSGKAIVIERIFRQRDELSATQLKEFLTGKLTEQSKRADAIMRKYVRCSQESDVVRITQSLDAAAMEELHLAVAQLLGEKPGQPAPQPMPPQPEATPAAIDLPDKLLAQDSAFFPNDTFRVQRVSCAKLAQAKLIEQYGDCPSLWGLDNYLGEGTTLKLNYTTEVDWLLHASARNEVFILHLLKPTKAEALYGEGKEFVVRRAGRWTLHLLGMEFAFFMPDERTVVAGPANAVIEIALRQGPPKCKEGLDKLLRATDAKVLYWDIDATDAPSASDPSVRGLLRELGSPGSVTQIEAGETLNLRVEQFYRDANSATRAEKSFGELVSLQRKNAKLSPAAKELLGKVKLSREGNTLRAAWSYDAAILDKLRAANFSERQQ